MTVDELLKLVPLELQAEYGRLTLKVKSLRAIIEGSDEVQELKEAIKRLGEIETEAKDLTTPKGEN